jgi:hypothetical protein
MPGPLTARALVRSVPVVVAIAAAAMFVADRGGGAGAGATTPAADAGVPASARAAAAEAAPTAPPAIASPVEVAAPSVDVAPVPEPVVDAPAPSVEEPTPAAVAAPVEPSGPVRVALYGDSLAFEAQGHFVAALTADGRAEVLTRTFGGTAICDWLPDMRRDAAEWQPREVVVEFSGNALTPCMRDADGGALSPDAYLQKYRDDAAEVVATFAGARVWFAGSPISRRAAETGDFNGGRLDDLYRAQPGAGFVDAGVAVLDGGRYTEALPCLPDEPCGDDGTNVVRAPDGAHFCPANPDAVRGVTQGCAVWSSGAWRYGRAMAAPVLADLGR